MARYDGKSGLFSMADFTNRGAIKLAPDALVFISGSLGTSVIAPVSGKTQNVDFKDGISSINIQNNIDPPGSSTATIEVVTPIYNDNSTYWVSFNSEDKQTRRVPIFVPMMEIKVFFKGRFLVEKEPKYYPAFWGFIVNVEENFSGGIYKITLQCADMLHWWQYINVAYHPSVPSHIFTGGRQGLTVYASRYKESNPFEIIYSLATEMYGLTEEAEKNKYSYFIAPDWLAKATGNQDIFPSNGINYVYGGILDYWRKRWASNVNILRMYGANGNLILNPHARKTQKVDNKSHQASVPTTDPGQLSTKTSVQTDFGVDDYFLSNYPTFHMFEAMGEMSNAEYMTKLEIATQVRNVAEYEFYQDVNGNFVFKPPFYNLNTKNVYPYRISPQDIINYSTGINSEEIVTALQVQVGIHPAIRKEDWVNRVGYHIDMDLTERFGERFKKICLWYLSQSQMARSAAVGHLSLMNVKAYNGSVTIPGRPEMKLGFPVYIDHKDAFYYVRSINHAFDYGGSFNTTLSLEGLRERIYGNTSEGPWKPLKNRIYKLKDNFTVKPEQNINSNLPDSQLKASSEKNPNDRLEQFYRDNGYIVSSQTGRYEIIEDKTEKIKSILTAVTDTKSKNAGFKFLDDSIPYTDEEGYKVIGSYRYGRGINLEKSGAMDSQNQKSSETKSSEEIKNTRDAENVTNMSPASEREGSEMQKHFSVTRNLGIESAIPDYLDLIGDIGQTTETIAVQLANATVKGAGYGEAVGDALLVQNVSNVKKVTTATPIGATGIQSARASIFPFRR